MKTPPNKRPNGRSGPRHGPKANTPRPFGSPLRPSSQWPGEDKLREFQAWRRGFAAKRAPAPQHRAARPSLSGARRLGPGDDTRPARPPRTPPTEIDAPTTEKIIQLLEASTDVEELSASLAKAKAKVRVDRKFYGDDESALTAETHARRAATALMRAESKRNAAATAVENATGLRASDAVALLGKKHPALLPEGGVDGMRGRGSQNNASKKRPSSGLKPCPKCGGSGQLYNATCSLCKGGGEVTDDDVRRARAAGLDGMRRSTQGTLACGCEGLAGCGCSKSVPRRRGLGAIAMDLTEEEQRRWRGKNVNRDANGVLRDMDNPADRKKFFASSMRDVTDMPVERARLMEEMANYRPSEVVKREIDKGAGEDWDQYIARKQRESAHTQREAAERENAARPFVPVSEPECAAPADEMSDAEKKYCEAAAKKKARKRGKKGVSGLGGGLGSAERQRLIDSIVNSGRSWWSIYTAYRNEPDVLAALRKAIGAEEYQRLQKENPPSSGLGTLGCPCGGPSKKDCTCLGGTPETDEHIRQAFVSAEDGRCGDVEKHLSAAEKAGANVSLHRKQLMQDCRAGAFAGGGHTPSKRGKTNRMNKSRPTPTVHLSSHLDGAPKAAAKPSAQEKKVEKKVAAAQAIVEKLESAVAEGNCRKSTTLLATATKAVAALPASADPKVAARLASKVKGLFAKTGGVCVVPGRGKK